MNKMELALYIWPGSGRGLRGLGSALHVLPGGEHLLDCFPGHIGGFLVVAHLGERMERER